MKICSLYLSLLLLFSCGCTKKTATEDLHDKKKILCTIAMISDLVQKIAEDNAVVVTLIQGQHDPHSYQLVKGDDEKFLNADCIFYCGLGLEHGSSLTVQLHDNPKAHSLGAFLEKNNAALISIDQITDPHIWMDVQLWSQTIPYIVDTLSALDPQHAAQFQENGKKVQRELQELDATIRSTLQQIPKEKRYLVTTHDAFHYFGRSYLAEANELCDSSWRVRVQAPEGLAPESQMSTADIHKLVEHLITNKIGAIFSESNVSSDSIRKLVDACSKRGFQVHIAKKPLFADSMGAKSSEADSYQKMMLYNTKIIRHELCPES